MSLQGEKGKGYSRQKKPWWRPHIKLAFLQCFSLLPDHPRSFVRSSVDVVIMRETAFVSRGFVNHPPSLPSFPPLGLITLPRSIIGVSLPLPPFPCTYLRETSVQFHFPIPLPLSLFYLRIALICFHSVASCQSRRRSRRRKTGKAIFVVVVDEGGQLLLPTFYSPQFLANLTFSPSLYTTTVRIHTHWPPPRHPPAFVKNFFSFCLFFVAAYCTPLLPQPPSRSGCEGLQRQREAVEVGSWGGEGRGEREGEGNS